MPEDDRRTRTLSIQCLTQERKEKATFDNSDPLCNDCYITTRDQLLQDCLAYFLRHGVAHLSLRPLAAAVGTSARMLLHYFGSKEALIAEVMDLVHFRLQSTFQELGKQRANRDGQHFLLSFWQALTARANRPSLRLLFEVQVLALQNPKRYCRYLTRTSVSWGKLIESTLPRGKNAATTATLFNAIVDGLLLELLATDDLPRTSKALKIFLAGFAPATAKAKRKARV